MAGKNRLFFEAFEAARDLIRRVETPDGIRAANIVHTSGEVVDAVNHVSRLAKQARFRAFEARQAAQTDPTNTFLARVADQAESEAETCQRVSDVLNERATKAGIQPPNPYHDVITELTQATKAYNDTLEKVENLIARNTVDGKIKPEAVDEVKQAILELEEVAGDFRFNAHEVQEAAKQLHDAVLQAEATKAPTLLVEGLRTAQRRMAEVAGEAALNAHNVIGEVKNIKAQAEALGVIGATAIVLIPNPAKARELQQQVEAIPQPPYPYVATAAGVVMGAAEAVDKGVAKVVNVQGTALTGGLIKNAGQRGLDNQETAVKGAMEHLIKPILTTKTGVAIAGPLVKLGASAVHETDASIDAMIDTVGLRDPIGKTKKAMDLPDDKPSVTDKAAERSKAVWDAAEKSNPKVDPNWKQTPTVFHQ